MVMPNNRPDSEIVRITQQLKEYHHAALWQEEVHFTWLQSIILAAQIALLSQSDIGKNGLWWVVALLGFIGILMAHITVKVLRRERTFFQDAEQRFRRQFNAFLPNDRISETPVPGLSILSYFIFIFWIFCSANLIIFVYSISMIIKAF